MSTEPVLLQANDIQVEVASKHLVANASFSITAGDVVALLGKNGCGKTSLLRQLCGFYPYSSGEVLVAGRPLRQLSDAERIHRICYVPQRLQSIPDVSVLEFLTACCPPATGKNTGAIEEALSHCSLASFADRLLPVLSGGELRRVLIATTFLNEAPVILLDEPTSNLDPTNHIAITSLIQNMASNGRAVLFATHDLNLDLHIANRVFSIYEQALHEETYTSEGLALERLKMIYSVPFTTNPQAVVPTDGEADG